jgi:rod shape-determining protein MreC
VLQIVALSFLFRYNKFHEAAFMGIANELTGRVSSRYSNVEYYFHLKKINESLAMQNERLLNEIKSNTQGADTSLQVITDTVHKDTSGANLKYVWRGARVVNNSVSLQNNYITIHRGESQGVKKDMGVIGPDGIVGMVVNTSENFAVVMSMLNRQSSVSAKLKKSREIGKVQWDGITPNYVTMINIPKNVQVATGDSVVTSGYSLSFPPEVLIGTVSEIVDDKTSNFYTLMIKPATNFYNLEYVTVVDNLQKEEQQKLEDATRKNQ